MSDKSGTVMVGDATFFGTPEACAAFVRAMSLAATEGRGTVAVDQVDDREAYLRVLKRRIRNKKPDGDALFGR